MGILKTERYSWTSCIIPKKTLQSNVASARQSTKGCQPSHSWAIFWFYPPAPQFVIFKSISYCFEETIEFDVKASFASRPVSRLIRWYIKPGDDITKEFWEKAIQFLGTFHGLKITNCPSLLGYFRYPNTNNLRF